MPARISHDAWTRLIAGFVLFMALFLACAPAFAAPPPANTAITNRAEATYIPDGQVLPETLHSNTVVVRVAAVEALLLTADQTVNRPVGSTVTLQHNLVNTGNTASTYALTLANATGDNFDLTDLRLVHDLNGNGLVDAGEPSLAGSTLTLLPGQTAQLLITGRVPLGADAGGVGQSRVTLSAVTQSTTPVSAQVTNVVRTGRLAALTLGKQADQAATLAVGTIVNYRISASNIGDTDAAPVGVAGPSATPIIIDGAPASVVLIADRIPEGMAFVPGSLSGSSPDAQRLYRLPLDPPYSYRSNGDDMAAVEVAIALRRSVAPNVTTGMTFAARVLPTAAGRAIANVAQAAYNDGVGAMTEQSNTVLLQAASQRVGVAKRAAPPVYENDAAGRLSGTALVRFTFVVQNFGVAPLTQVQLRDVLEGPSAFGTYTPNAQPVAGEYTVVAASARSMSLSNGATLTFNPGYTGRAGDADLLAAGSVLPPGGAAELGVDVRINVQGRDGVINNTAQASARSEAVAAELRDDSANGSAPDANGDGDPTNDASPTPVLLSLPSIAVDKTASPVRRLPGPARRYEVDYTLTVTNNGRSNAAYVQVAENLGCTFKEHINPLPVRSWSLTGAPVFANGLLRPNAAFTGRAPCTTAPSMGGDPYQAQQRAPAVQLTDGTRHLSPGQTEVIRFTVQFELEPLVRASDRTFDNVAIASLQDRADSAAANIVVASQGVARITPIDPSGVVYHALTRAPIPGATVFLRRLSCSGTPGAGITPAEILPLPGTTYTFNADGSVSQVSDAQGRYYFFLLSPPVVQNCEYGLSVTPAPGSGLVYPSRLLPVTPGAAPGGAVQVQGDAPSTGAVTTYFTLFTLGPGLPDVWNNHVPLDPQGGADGLLAQKSANRTVVEIGQTLDYTVEMRNISGRSLLGLGVSDLLPTGMRYVAGSARFNGATSADPIGAPGPRLQFNWPTASLAAEGVARLTYRVQVGIGSSLGPVINRAFASAEGLASNETTATVRVEGGVFADEGYLVGKVYLDCSRDGVQGHQEIGIPGVRLILEDGTGVVTDVEGKYSLYGLRSITHVLKLDASTLPARARLAPISNRHSGRGDSRFVDLKKGELHKADFAVDNCDVSEVLNEVQARRKALAFRADAEGEAVSRARLEPVAPNESSLADVRRRAAVGEVTAQGVRPAGAAAPTAPVAAAAATAPAAKVFEPLTLPQNLPPPGIPSDTSPRAATPRVDLESMLESATTQAAFVDLKDRDTLATAQIDVRVKGRLGTTLRLSINGQAESEQRVGKRVRIASRELEAWEYIGVKLNPGKNTLRLEEVDSFGTVRSTQSIDVIAPGRMARIELSAPATAIADASTATPVQVRLVDEQGVLVTARTQLTLEIDYGRWETTDLNPGEPGVQVFIEGGQAEFKIIPPNEPIDARIRISSGALQAERRLAYLPELRALVGSGIVEGVVDLRRRGVTPVGGSNVDAFEQTLRNLSRSDGRAAARVAFYFKGTVRGEYLLTAAFDSDKQTREKLFRDIQPDKHYPIYGDSSARLFDAQSSGRLYVRIDHERSWLLFGDFVAADAAQVNVDADPRRLSQTNRSATGLKAHHETDSTSITAYASKDKLSQQVIELPADGTSGPYTVPGSAQWRENSERIELVVRDRNQNAVVLRTVVLQRFTDYVIDTVSRRILFARPIASLDENLNPSFLRITLEVESGGPSFWMGGAHVQHKVNDGLQLGASVHIDRDPVRPTTLAGVTAVVRPAFDPKTTIMAEVARSHVDNQGTGNAARLEVQRDGSDVAVRGQIVATDSGFRNDGAGLSPGRVDANVSAQTRTEAGTALRAEGLFSRDSNTDSTRAAALVTAGRELTTDVVGEIGVRAARDSTNSPLGRTDNDVLALHGKLSMRLPAWQAQVYVEADQDVRDSDKRLVAIGGERQLNEKTRVYGRYEVISSLGASVALNSTQQNNVAVIGLDSSYIEDGRIFNELRLRDALGGREGQFATGLRKSWLVSPGLRLSGSAEHTRAFGGVAGNRSTALTGAVEYSADERMRVFTSLETRLADTGDSALHAMGLSYKIDKDWSLLARSTVSVQNNDAADSQTLLARQQLGVAWRQVDINRWNGLARYEHVLRNVDGGSSSEREQSHIISTHLNYQPARDWIFSGRYAWRTTQFNENGVRSSDQSQLIYGRAMWDFAPRWDASLQAGYAWGKGGFARYVLGLEVGAQVVDNLWLSVGYNASGIDDDLLSGSDHLRRGGFLRLRYKFDEHLFK
jgi:large repetitive protein